MGFGTSGLGHTIVVSRAIFVAILKVVFVCAGENSVRD